MTNITITGVNFINKGAELMTLSILKEISNWKGDNIISAPLGTGNFQQRKSVGLSHLVFPATADLYCYQIIIFRIVRFISFRS